jgi:uncharacterized protein YgfB (UPF0149 family)
MIDRLVAGALNALSGAIKVVLLFGVLVGLVVWAGTNPESWKAAMSAVAGLGVAVVTWLAELLQTWLDQASDAQ